MHSDVVVVGAVDVVGAVVVRSRQSPEPCPASVHVGFEHGWAFVHEAPVVVAEAPGSAIPLRAAKPAPPNPANARPAATSTAAAPFRARRRRRAASQSVENRRKTPLSAEP